MKKTLLFASIFLTLPTVSNTSPYFSLQDGKSFKRFSISVGALHVMPQGKAQPLHVNTAVKKGETSKVGNVSIDAVKRHLAPNMAPNLSSIFVNILDRLNIDTLPSSISGTAKINGLESWNNPGTGLEANDVTTLGIMTNYFFTDNISFEAKVGIPPKVDLLGKGKIYAPFSAVATPQLPRLLGGINLPSISMQKDLLITDLEAYGPTASARAWTPAFEFQYHFGKTGVNKFRPYVGLGVMYAYFNELKLNPRTERDLVAAGHMIANIKENRAGASLEGKPSKANPKVELAASDVFAPVATVGFTYDFNESWFAVGSLSYAHLQNDTTITVTDAVHGELIRAKADIEINPILAYAGIGIRF